MAIKDINTIVSDNIFDVMKEKKIKQVALAEGIGVSKQTMSKMLNGGRIITAMELKRIADFLNVSMDKLVSMPALFSQNDVIHTFMGKVETDKAKDALKIADEVSDMILFHNTVRKNGVKLMRPVGNK